MRPGTDAPTSGPTAGPTVAPPTDAPVPTRTPKPTAAAAPNLVVRKFEIDANFILAETPVDALITVRNTGTQDAGRFSVAIKETNTDGGATSTSDPFAVEEGLAAGATKNITISITLPTAGHWKLTAVADTDAEVDESNEDDNSSEIAVNVLAGLPDFAWYKDGFSVFDQSEVTADGHKIELEAKFQNVGTATYSSSPISIGIKWYRDEDSASGDLTPFSFADDMEPGATPVDLTKIDYLPGPGTYTLYAYLDDGRVIDELSEDNNEAQAVITIN